MERSRREATGSVVLHRLMQQKTARMNSVTGGLALDWEDILLRRVSLTLAPFGGVEVHLGQLRGSGVSASLLDWVAFCRLFNGLRSVISSVDWATMRQFHTAALTRSHQNVKQQRRVRVYLEEIGPIAERLRERLQGLTREYLLEHGGTPRRRRDIQYGFHQLYKKVSFVYFQWVQEIADAAGETGLPPDYVSQLRTFEGDVASFVRDPAGAQFWREKVRGFLVAWKDLKTQLQIWWQRELPDDVDRAMRRVLDLSDSGMVNAVSFGDFVAGFGPFDRLLENAPSLLLNPWFQGHASLQEAARMLDAEPPGSFLVRLRDCSSGEFAIAFVHPEIRDRLVHVAVENSSTSAPSSSSAGGGGGYVIRQGDRDLHFATFADILRTYGRFLRVPLQTHLTQMGWFYGDISGREATELLAGQTVASYLVRFSQGNPNCLATAYVSHDGKIVHSLIEKTAHGFRHGTDPLFPSLDELLQAYQAVLSFPFISGYSWYDELAQKCAARVDGELEPAAQELLLSPTADDLLLPSSGAEAQYVYPIPLVAEQCILFLCDRKNGATADLFVASRSAQEVAELKQLFEKKVDVDIFTYHPHVVAQLLKVYLREMPKPLIPEPLFDAFVELSELTPLPLAQSLLAQLPHESRTLLRYLLKMTSSLLLDTAKNHLTSLMLAQQLGPNILRRQDLSMEESLAVTDSVFRAAKYLIDMAAPLLGPELDALMVDGVYMDDLVLTPNRLTIKSGSLAKILTALYEPIPGAAIRSASFGAKFRLTYESFLSSSDLLSMLVQLFHEEDPVGLPPSNALSASPPMGSSTAVGEGETTTSGGGGGGGSSLKVRRLKIVAFLGKWVTEQAHVFLADGGALMERLAQFRDSITDTTLAQHLVNAMDRVNRSVNKVTTFASEPPATKKLPKKIAACLDVPSIEMARQLTLIMYELYAKIRPSELVEVRWQKGDEAERQARAGNVLAVSAQYNRTVMWVVTELLTAKNRSKAVSYFLALMEDFRALNNFNGLFAVVSAFSNAAVARLAEVKGLKKAEEQKMHEFNAYLNTAGNYKYYRDCVKKANPPIVPYLGTFLTDLLMIQEGNKLRLENGHINFRKCYATSIVIQNVQQYQLSPYNLTPVPLLAEYLSSFKPFNDDEAWARSQSIQPPS